MKNNTITIYTDGSCINNPGKGGYSFIIVCPRGIEYSSSDGYKLTTNNRMELMPVIKALEGITPGPDIHIYSDSTYVVNTINSWLTSWKANGWRKSGNKTLENIDLLKKLDFQLVRHSHSTQAHHVGRNSGNEYNMRCDNAAKKAAQKPNLLVDPGYKPKPAKVKQAA